MGALLGGLRTRRAIYATIARVAYGCTAVAAQAKHRANSALAMTLTPAKAAKAAAKWHITTQATKAQAAKKGETASGRVEASSGKLQPPKVGATPPWWRR